MYIANLNGQNHTNTENLGIKQFVSGPGLKIFNFNKKNTAEQWDYLQYNYAYLCLVKKM